MRWNILCVIPVLCLHALVLPPATQAEKASWLDSGIRVGKSLRHTSEQVESFDLFLSYGLPWNRPTPSGWVASTTLSGAVGFLQGGGDRAEIVSAGPGISWAKSGGRLAVHAGCRVALLTGENFGRLDLGGALQFIFHLSLGVEPTRNSALRYRIQHMSNANIYEENPGLNIQMIELAYRF